VNPLNWLKLSLIPGIGDRTIHQLIAAFGSPEAVLASGRNALTAYLTAKQIEALLVGPDSALLAQTEAWLAQPSQA